jgi:hypothetical protein
MPRLRDLSSSSSRAIADRLDFQAGYAPAAEEIGYPSKRQAGLIATGRYRQ